MIDAIFNVREDVDDDFESEEDEDEVMFEIEMEEEYMDEDDMGYDMEEEFMYEIEMEEDMDDDEIGDEELDESYDHRRSVREAKSTVKPKGVGIGKGPKFAYKKTEGGFDEDKKVAPKTMGTGKAKFEYKKGANMEGKSKVVDWFGSGEQLGYVSLIQFLADNETDYPDANMTLFKNQNQFGL